MAERYYWQPASTPQIGSIVSLDQEQTRHIVQVMRLGVGSELLLFDGTGWEYQAVIDSIQKRSLNAKIASKWRPATLLERSITVATALPKGDRQRFLVEKLVELGVESLVPLKTHRSIAEFKPGVADRFNKWVIEACKQCRRSTLMQIGSEHSVEDLIERDWPENNQINLVAHPYGPGLPSIAELTLAPKQPVLIAIGPEGGFDEREIERLLSRKFRIVSLGRGILRTETAAIVGSALLAAQ